MYIPEFWCGFIIGALACIAACITIGLVSNKNKKR